MYPRTPPQRHIVDNIPIPTMSHDHHLPDSLASDHLLPLFTREYVYLFVFKQGLSFLLPNVFYASGSGQNHTLLFDFGGQILISSTAASI